MTAFGQKLRQMREDRHISITVLSQATGLSRSSIYTWETGEKMPKSLATVNVLADFFGIPPETFFRDADVDLSDEVRQLREEVADLRRQITGAGAIQP